MVSFGGKGLSQRPSVSLIINKESAIIITTVKEAFLIVAVCSIADHGPPHGLQQQHELQTSTSSQAEAWNTDTNTVFRDNMNHRHQPTTWPRAVTLLMDISMVSVSRIMY